MNNQLISFNYIYKVASYLFFIFIFNTTLDLRAHQLNRNHGLCLKAIDYSGCIKHNLKDIGSISDNDFQSNWLIYGPLKINYAEARRKNNIFFFPLLNKDNLPYFLAVDCANKVFNLTNQSLKWRNWFRPNYNYEKSILSDICNN